VKTFKKQLEWVTAIGVKQEGVAPRQPRDRSGGLCFGKPPATGGEFLHLAGPTQSRRT